MAASGILWSDSKGKGGDGLQYKGSCSSIDLRHIRRRQLAGRLVQTLLCVSHCRAHYPLMLGVPLLRNQVYL